MAESPDRSGTPYAGQEDTRRDNVRRDNVQWDADLLSLLVPDRVNADSFRALSPTLGGRRNVFGGQMVAQALIAAARTVGEAKPIHSFHAYHAREGRFEESVDIVVDRLRDGRSFSTRRVETRQADRSVTIMCASFHLDEPGEELPGSRTASMPVPPTGLITRHPYTAFAYGVDMVPAGDTFRAGDGIVAWCRARRPLPPDRTAHCAVLAYLSDLYGDVLGRHARRRGEQGILIATLDHSMWFHRAPRADQWLLFDVRPVALAGSRGVLSGSVRDAAGTLIATFTQELLIRDSGPIPPIV